MCNLHSVWVALLLKLAFWWCAELHFLEDWWRGQRERPVKFGRLGEDGEEEGEHDRGKGWH